MVSSRVKFPRMDTKFAFASATLKNGLPIPSVTRSLVLFPRTMDDSTKVIHLLFKGEPT